MNKNQKGFGHIAIVLIIVVVGFIGLVGWRVMSSNKNNDVVSVNDGSSNTPNNQTTTKDSGSIVSWEWNGSKWQSSGQAPSCNDPVKFSVAPTDLSKATAVLYPGQSRGGNYKPHGGFRFDNSTNSDVTVKAIMDGYVVSGSRYIESGETQYVFTIENSCGIAYRYDHLATLSETMQKIADSLPEPKVDDSRTTKFESPIQVKSGDVIATSVGFKNNSNVSFDLGVYDYRQTNEAAKDANFVKTHQNELSQAGYALCWFDMFSTSDSDLMKSLPAADANAGKTSDYCE